MSVEASTDPVEDARGTLAQRRAAFRLAFGVTSSFAIAEALDWDFTFVGPMLAAQLLVKMQRPPTIAQGLGLVVIIALTTSLVLVLTNWLISAPAVLILALALLLTLTYYAPWDQTQNSSVIAAGFRCVSTCQKLR